MTLFCSSLWMSSILFYICTVAAAAKPLQLCPTLCDPTNGSPPGSPVPGILQARALEWVAISIFNAWKGKVKVKSLSRVRLLATPWTATHQAPPPMGFFQARVLEWGAIAFSLYMHYIFFTHSSVNGHLGCFHVLASVNSAAGNTWLHVSFWIMAFSGYMSSSGILSLCF